VSRVGIEPLHPTSIMPLRTASPFQSNCTWHKALVRTPPHWFQDPRLVERICRFPKTQQTTTNNRTGASLFSHQFPNSHSRIFKASGKPKVGLRFMAGYRWNKRIRTLWQPQAYRKTMFTIFQTKQLAATICVTKHYEYERHSRRLQ